jgi:hypothetical protein
VQRTRVDNLAREPAEHLIIPIIGITLDITPEATGQRVALDEVGVYTV